MFFKSNIIKAIEEQIENNAHDMIKNAANIAGYNFFNQKDIEKLASDISSELSSRFYLKEV